ncbi:DUF2235 domain-containing protein [Mangrovicoccus ximenensis]|uniref:DUF2235 domain-containing protein n=1 Tax=Mangrovicoccus ximenensis TaxID=1911570 RepID=UPI000D3B2338|nr:DUF2235 domain-containing protein [Mangrovicoccus ximenensis]
MKRIAIFCDGTWNRSDRAVLAEEGRPITNILRLSEAAVDGMAPDGIAQKVFYIDGVGTPGDVGRIRHTIDKVGGGVFGWGLDDKILKAYRFLIRTYEPGDEIFVFGFSRGAYTARSLVGLLRNCSLPLSDEPALLGHLMGVYRSRRPGDAPWEARARSLRAWVNPGLATEPEEAESRPGACELLRIRYMGIFDTVGALGVPELWPGLARVNKRYRFHDQKLSSMVMAARHVISIDEPRATYKSVPWDAEKLAELNAKAEGQPYRQLWFPGVHGTVGGSLTEGHQGLGMETLGWIAGGAEEAGLAFDPEMLAAFAGAADAEGPFGNPELTYKLVDRLTLRFFPGPRGAVAAAGDVSDTARRRWTAPSPPSPPSSSVAPAAMPPWPPLPPIDWTRIPSECAPLVVIVPPSLEKIA